MISTDDVSLAASLRIAGFDAKELSRLVQDGQLFPLRRGAYSTRLGQSPEERHRHLALASMALLSAEACLSHVSAAVLHELPVWPDQLSRLREMGFEVVRWTWDDLQRPYVLEQRVLSALVRGSRR